MSNKKYNILFITLSDLSGQSGHNIATKEIVKSFSQNSRVRLNLVCPEPVGSTPDMVIKNTNVVRHTPERRDPSKFKRLTEQIHLAQSIRSVLKQTQPDFIIARMNPTLVVPPISTLVSKLPYVLLVRGLAHKELKYSSILSNVFWLNVRIADIVFAAHSGVKAEVDSVRKPDQSKSIISSNAVDPDIFPPSSISDARQDLDIELDDNFVVGSVSSLKEYHKVDELIRAVATLVEDIDIKLLIVGDGPQRKQLERLVKREGVENHIYFTGFVPHEDVHRYISACDVLYGGVDQNRPGNAIKCYEYLACERPIITTSTPEFSFVENRELGIGLDKVNQQTILDAITRLYSLDADERHLMGQRGRNYVIKNHTWDGFVDEILETMPSHITD